MQELVRYNPTVNGSIAEKMGRDVPDFRTSYWTRTTSFDVKVIRYVTCVVCEQNQDTMTRSWSNIMDLMVCSRTVLDVILSIRTDAHVLYTARTNEYWKLKY